MPESRKYRLAKSWRIFISVVAPLLITLFVGMPLLWWLEKPMPLLTALYCLLPLGLALLFLYGLAEAIWGYVAISPEGMVEMSVLGRRQLAWVEIKGYQLGRNYLRLLPTDTRRRTYTLAVAAGLLLPLGAAVAQWLYPGQLRADEPDTSGVPSLGIALVAPSVGLFGRMLLDAELVSVAAIQPWAYPIGSSFALLLVAGSLPQLVGKNRDAGLLLVILPAALLYGFSAPVAYNVAFDTSKPAYYAPRLLRKYINSNEFAGCIAVVAPWGPFRDSALVHVSRAHYNQLRPGNPVRVRFMPGTLGVAWFKAAE